MTVLHLVTSSYILLSPATGQLLHPGHRRITNLAQVPEYGVGFFLRLATPQLVGYGRAASLLLLPGPWTSEAGPAYG